MTIWAFRRRNQLLRFSRRRWQELITELGRRGNGEREAGAFLLAHRDGDWHEVVRLVYLDDLDPHCLQGHIHFDGRAYTGLWDICDDSQLIVVGDVHTHGGSHVHQSSIDAQNPMLARVGHVALIVPHLATRLVRPNEIGVHQYRGDTWRTWTGANAARRIKVGWWR